MHISVVVPTYKRATEVRQLLLNLTQQVRRPDEVIVVDSSPDDETAKTVKGLYGSVAYKLAYAPSKKGLTRQRNVGVMEATGEIICFLDDDVLLEPDFLNAVAKVFERDKEGAVGGVCGYIVNEGGQKPGLKWQVRRWLLPGLTLKPGTYHHRTGLSVPLPFAEPFEGNREVDYLPGCCTAYRREILCTCPFDTRFEGYGQGEDLHYSLGVGQRFRLLYCNDARLRHLHAASGRPNPRERGAMVVRNRYYIYRSYRGRQKADFWFWWAMFLDLCFALASFIKGPQRRDRLGFLSGMVMGVMDCLLGRPGQVEHTERVPG